MATPPWVLLLLAAAATASSTTRTKGFETRTSIVMSDGTFISSPSALRRTKTTLPSSNVASLVTMESSSPNQYLQQQILRGAARKLLRREVDTSGSVISPRATKLHNEDKIMSLVGQYTYYVREGRRSGESIVHNTEQASTRMYPDGIVEPRTSTSISLLSFLFTCRN